MLEQCLVTFAYLAAKTHSVVFIFKHWLKLDQYESSL